MTWRCGVHGYNHGESPPCPPDEPDWQAERRARTAPKVCTRCGSAFCDRVAAAVPGLTPPRCLFGDRQAS